MGSIIRRLLGLWKPDASEKPASTDEAIHGEGAAYEEGARVPDASRSPVATDEAVHAKVAAYKKVAWIPEVVDGDGAPSDSKFSGLAFIPADQEWPECGNCGQPMQLFVQINSEELPDEAREYLAAGILQLFYCTNWDEECEVECDAFFPFSRASLVRIIEPIDASPIATSPVKDSFPPRRITGWHSAIDYPSWEELKLMGVHLTDSERDQISDSCAPAGGEKLGGWPAWVQGVEYPRCPECREQMHHVFQVDSENNIPYMFGDVGRGHITQCRNHPHILAFAWACY